MRYIQLYANNLKQGVICNFEILWATSPSEIPKLAEISWAASPSEIPASPIVQRNIVRRCCRGPPPYDFEAHGRRASEQGLRMTLDAGRPAATARTKAVAQSNLKAAAAARGKECAGARTFAHAMLMYVPYLPPLPRPPLLTTHCGGHGAGWQVLNRPKRGGADSDAETSSDTDLASVRQVCRYTYSFLSIFLHILAHY